MEISRIEVKGTILIGTDEWWTPPKALCTTRGISQNQRLKGMLVRSML